MSRWGPGPKRLHTAKATGKAGRGGRRQPNSGERSRGGCSRLDQRLPAAAQPGRRVVQRLQLRVHGRQRRQHSQHWGRLAAEAWARRQGSPVEPGQGGLTNRLRCAPRADALAAASPQPPQRLLDSKLGGAPALLHAHLALRALGLERRLLLRCPAPLAGRRVGGCPWPSR